MEWLLLDKYNSYQNDNINFAVFIKSLYKYNLNWQFNIKLQIILENIIAIVDDPRYLFEVSKFLF